MYKKVFSLLVISGVLFQSCLKKKQVDPPTISALMIANLAHDRPNTGFAVGNANITSAVLGFFNYTKEYAAVYSGASKVRAYFANNPNSVIATTETNFEEEQFYSSFLIGAAGNYKNLVVNDRVHNLPLLSGKAYIRYVYAVPDSSSSIVAVSIDDVPAMSESARFGSLSSFVAVNAGNMQVKTNNFSNISTTLSALLEEKKIYTIIVAGNPASANADSVQTKVIENGVL